MDLVGQQELQQEWQQELQYHSLMTEPSTRKSHPSSIKLQKFVLENLVYI